MSPTQRTLAVTASLMLLPGLGSAQDFSVPAPVREQWSARLTLGLDSAARRPVASLLGDHYFQQGRLSILGAPRSGFRATSGLMFGAGSAALGAASALGGLNTTGFTLRDAASAGSGSAWPEAIAPQWVTQPYAGLGYSHQADDGAWGVSADVGVVAATAVADWSLGRALLGPNRLDEAVRTLRLRPVLQLGMRYRF
jgi:hypothetical protein